MRPFPEGSIHTPLVPFDANGDISLDDFTRVVRFHVDAGARGILLVSHGAELHALRRGERLDLAAAGVAEIAGAVPLWLHVSASATAHAIELARHAESVGAAAIVLTVPYYWRLSDQAVEEHLSSVARSVRTPVVLYNSPAHQRAVNIPPRTVERLVAELPTWAGVLDGGHNYEQFAVVRRILDEARPDLGLAIEGEYVLPAFLMGAQAALCPLACFAPNLVGDLVRAVEGRDLDTARALQDKAALLLALIRPNPVARLKAASAIFGRDLGPPRAPVPEATAEVRAEVDRAIDELGLRESEPHGWDALSHCERSRG